MVNPREVVVVVSEERVVVVSLVVDFLVVDEVVDAPLNGGQVHGSVTF